jgi:hypothetical protein
MKEVDRMAAVSAAASGRVIIYASMQSDAVQKRL